MAHVGLIRNGGVGDVLMVLCAANALKACGHSVTLFTSEKMREIAKCCPHVDHVISKETLKYNSFDHCDHVFDLGSAIHGVKGMHMVDVFLEVMGIEAPPLHKELQLVWPREAYDEAAKFKKNKRVLLHPGLSDPNRSWSKEKWEKLARMLVELDYEVIQIGKGSPRLDVEGIIDCVDGLSLCGLGVLMERSDLLVSFDSGPIQLAGATSIAIVGIYTVVKANDRLPYRRGELGWNCTAIETSECPWFPCYKHMLDPKVWKPYEKRIHEGETTVGEVFSNWCLHQKKLSCLSELGWETVLEYSLEALKKNEEMSAEFIS